MIGLLWVPRMGLVPQFLAHETPKTPKKNWHETWTSNLWKGKSFKPNLHDLEIHVIFWGCNDHPLISHTNRGFWSHKKTQTIKHTFTGFTGFTFTAGKLRNDNFCDCSDCADEVNWNCDTCGALDGDDGEEATDVGSEFGCQEGKRCGKRKTLVVCFFVWGVFAGQEDLNTLSLVETQFCWISLLSKSSKLFICSSDLQKP